MKCEAPVILVLCQKINLLVEVLWEAAASELMRGKKIEKENICNTSFESKSIWVDYGCWCCCCGFFSFWLVWNVFFKLRERKCKSKAIHTINNNLLSQHSTKIHSLRTDWNLFAWILVINYAYLCKTKTFIKFITAHFTLQGFADKLKHVANELMSCLNKNEHFKRSYATGFSSGSTDGFSYRLTNRFTAGFTNRPATGTAT